VGRHGVRGAADALDALGWRGNLGALLDGVLQPPLKLHTVLVSADLQISPRAIVNEKELEVLIGEPYIMRDDERKLLGKTAVTGHRLKKPQPTLVYDLSDDDDDDESDYHNKLL